MRNFFEFCLENASKNDLGDFYSSYDDYIANACYDTLRAVKIYNPPAQWQDNYKNFKKYLFNHIGFSSEGRVAAAMAWRKWRKLRINVPPLNEVQKCMAKDHRYLPFVLLRTNNNQYHVVDRDFKIYKTLKINITSEIARVLSWNGSDDCGEIQLYEKFGSPFCNQWALRYKSDEAAQKEYQDFKDEYRNKLDLIASRRNTYQGQNS